jgi:hypothetical protein
MRAGVSGQEPIDGRLQIALARCSRNVHIFAVMDDKLNTFQPGQLLARGTARLLAGYGYASVEELVPCRGLRVDVMGLGPKGEIWIIECKSSRADFQSDQKWHGYLEWCDRFFWAVDDAFPTDLLPDHTGLIIGDAYGGEIIRMGPESKLAPARRKVMLQKFAITAARRLHSLRDPDLEPAWG